jgi:hypothetical protein
MPIPMYIALANAFVAGVCLGAVLYNRSPWSAFWAAANAISVVWNVHSSLSMLGGA